MGNIGHERRRIEVLPDPGPSAPERTPPAEPAREPVQPREPAPEPASVP